jgi:hypothetical protein
MRTIKIRADVAQALHDYNMSTRGRGLAPNGVVTDPEVIDRLEALAMPGEDLNDTILRVLRGNASSAIN